MKLCDFLEPLWAGLTRADSASDPFSQLSPIEVPVKPKTEATQMNNQEKQTSISQGFLALDLCSIALRELRQGKPIQELNGICVLLWLPCCCSRSHLRHQVELHWHDSPEQGWYSYHPLDQKHAAQRQADPGR